VGKTSSSNVLTWRHRSAAAQQVGGREARAAGLQAKAGEALEDDAGEVVPVADDVGEHADEQRLLHQPGEDVVIAAPGPEERRQRDVDHDQRRGDEGDFTTQQAKAGIDVAGWSRIGPSSWSGSIRPLS
jgi:hypothetical protein